ncbi:ATP-binding protein [Evansella clarkii]|uniref:ATP-binding protein n=1 Tax=Evansella clarkii TaxID=79879 RepID=UPI000B43AC8D|nr:HAMP domain-containing sensor histidine kinase [Evansella clarkii]
MKRGEAELNPITSSLREQLVKKEYSIVSELVESFNTRFGTHVHFKADLEYNIRTIFGYFLDFITEPNEDRISQAGKGIEKYRISKGIDWKDLALFLEDSRAIVESWITEQKLPDVEKANGIANLNKFYFYLHKSVSLYADQVKNDELRKKNEQLQQLESERMKTLTKLSNTFAHEIRNPLTSIKGFVQLLESRLTAPSEEHMYFHYINQEINELEEQVNQILLLSNNKNHQDTNITAVSLKKLIEITIHAFHPVFQEHMIEMEAFYEKDVNLPGIEDQLKLALYKLVQNAVDALINKPEDRKIKISLDVMEDDEVILLIANNGPPIPQMLKGSLFDPFVGTKELGKGLGLAITKQIVSKHNGYISVYSIDNWTSFKITFNSSLSSINQNKI